jgi:hypothetical protein
LTVGLPLVTFGLERAGWPVLAALLPPGTTYSASTAPLSVPWVAGAVLAGGLAHVIARRAMRHCDAQLRDWYSRHHGAKVMS